MSVSDKGDMQNVQGWGSSRNVVENHCTRWGKIHHILVHILLILLTGESAIPEMQKKISQMTTIITIIILSKNISYQFNHYTKMYIWVRLRLN